LVIRSVEVRVCRNPRKTTSQGEMGAGGNSNFEFLIVSMKTDSGIEGHSLGFAGRGADMAGTIAASALKPFFEGRDPLFREQLWQDFRTYDRWWNHVPIYSYGPFDICLWDIAGKMCGLPLYKLLGAYRDKVPVYASSFVLDTPEDYARQALEAKTHRWHAYKLHPPGRVDLDLAAYRACREAVGPDFVMMVDVCYCWSNAKEALRVIRQLEPYDLFFLETPLQLDDLDGYAFLHDQCGIPIAAGELQNTRFEFLDLMDRGKVDVAQPDVGRVGGFTEARRVCDLAAERGRLIVPHCWKTGIGIAASAHLSAATAHCPYIEFLPAQLAESALRRELVQDELQMIDGMIPLPQKPGLGIELNQDALKKFRVQ